MHVVDLDQAIQEFLWHCQFEKNLSPKTLKAYALDLKQFTRHVREHLNGQPIDSIEKQHLRTYIQVIHDNYKPRSQKRKIASLKAFFAYLEFEDRLAVNPFRKMRINVAKARPLPRVISRPMMERVFLALYERLRLAGPNERPWALRDAAVVELLFATGMRVGELCALAPSDVDVEARRVRVMGKGSRERVVPILEPQVLELLSSYESRHAALQREQSRYIVHPSGHYRDHHARALVRELGQQAKLDQRLTPHMFRHTVATLLLENGVDIRNIQYFLGHSSISVTEIYTQVTNSAQQELLGEKHPRGGMRFG